METKVKKPFYKKWWFWVLAVVIVGAVANAVGGGTDESVKDNSDKKVTQKATKTEKPSKPVSKEDNKEVNKEANKEATDTSKPEPEPKPAKKETNKPTITLDEFNRIQNGMTYDQVVNIIGGKGTLQSSAGDGQYKTEMYMWEGEGGFGANANVTFQGGKVEAKAQLGLQ